MTQSCVDFVELLSDSIFLLKPLYLLETKLLILSGLTDSLSRCCSGFHVEEERPKYK